MSNNSDKTSNGRPVASLSLDLDNKWSYLKTHGDPVWQDYPGYLDVVVPRMNGLLESCGLSMTVFVVGKDAELPHNHDPLNMLVQAGHEIGNHSFHHEPWLHLYTDDQLKEEFDRSEAAIERATGQKTIGFRGPGFSFSIDVIRELMRRGYAYDGTTFPSSLGPVARAYYFMTANFSREQKEKRKELFGGFRDALQYNRPFVWTDEDRRLVEIPVTTMPFSRFPIHASYLNFLAQFSTSLAKMYFFKAITLCRLTGTPPSLLLHPLDFLGSDDGSDLSFFPGMKRRSGDKIQLLARCLEMMTGHFDVGTMRRQAELLSTESLPTQSVGSIRMNVRPSFAGR